MEKLSSTNIQSWLSWFLRGLLILGFLILIGRLAELQLIKGEYFKGLAEGNRIRRVTIAAPRGKIIARGGEVLVGNKKVEKRVIFNPESGYQKTKDVSGANQDELITESEREYFLAEIFAHVSGYIGETQEDEVGRVKAECPDKGIRKLGTLVGRTGLEQLYDCKLRGSDGEQLIEVDSMGQRVRVLGEKDAIAGDDLETTIDYQLQEKVAESMGDKKGAVIVSKSRGEVLSLYSSPSYDPNIFVKEGSVNEVSNVLNNEDLPLFNRAIGGAFHPGSVFKPIVATAALEEGAIDQNYTYEDTGAITINTSYGTFTYSNWYLTQHGGTEGEIGIERAIARSTDTFFYKVGEELGIENLVEWSEEFGMNQKTGIDLPGEVVGLLPSPAWKLETKGERWFLGNTYHMSIGQGDLTTTPMAIHRAISGIAADGKLCTPHVSGEVDHCRELNLSSESLKLVKEGMKQACRDGGTAFPFFDFADEHEGIEVACKTGTAETSDASDDTHAWFTAFAPVENPEIVVTVLIEKGGEGSSEAAPVAREIMDFWYSDNQND